MEAWRDARRTAWRTAILVITTGVLAVLLVGTAVKLKITGVEQLTSTKALPRSTRMRATLRIWRTTLAARPDSA